jgi:hypothetical protein
VPPLLLHHRIIKIATQNCVLRARSCGWHGSHQLHRRRLLPSPAHSFACILPPEMGLTQVVMAAASDYFFQLHALTVEHVPALADTQAFSVVLGMAIVLVCMLFSAALADKSKPPSLSLIWPLVRCVWYTAAPRASFPLCTRCCRSLTTTRFCVLCSRAPTRTHLVASPL